MLSVDAVVDVVRPHTDWTDVAARLLAGVGYGVVVLGLAGAAMRRAVDR
jgi:hypothetical protein